MNTRPTIMVSSTFYDLRQIRKDLNEFISDEIGYAPLLSEFPSFPVDPDIETIENCRRRVQENADILILVIGGRYGSIDSKTDKSITNLEFLTARTKGIPVYVFVDKAMLAILPLWKKNPDIDLSSVADTPRVFEFIEQIRNNEHIWTFDFETAQDIISTVRVQLAYLVQDSLKLRRLLASSGIPRFMEELGPKALRLVLEKPAMWEHRLFCQVLYDEVQKRNDLLNEYKAGLRLKPAEYIPSDYAPAWFLTQNHHLENLVKALNSLYNVSLHDAIGAPGEPGNPEKIVWVSKTLGRTFEYILNWAAQIRSARCEEPYDHLAPEAALFADDIITQLETYPTKSLQKIEEALAALPSSEKILVDISLTVTMSNEDRYFEAMEKVRRLLGLG